MTDGARFALTTSVIGANFAYPRRVAFTRSMTKRFSTSHTPSRSGPRPAFIAPITVASWLELPIPQLWRPAAMSSWIARNTLTSTCARALLGP
jgi:hypothetical protein